MDLGRRFLDGFFAAVMLVAALTLHTGFADILSSGGNAFAKLGGVLSGQAASPFYRTPQ